MSRQNSFSRSPWLISAREFASQNLVWLVAFLSIAVLLVWWKLGSAPFVGNWDANQALRQPRQEHGTNNQPTPPAINDNAVPVDSQIDFTIGNGAYPDEQSELKAEVKRALGYVSKEYISKGFSDKPILLSKFRAAIVIDKDCRLHGVAYTDERIVQVFTCNNFPRSQAVAIIAHEFVHQFEYDRYGPAHLNSDAILSEGLATLIAGEYWLGNHPDFRSYVREQRQAGSFLPLVTKPNGQNTEVMNALYYQWASFVDFLISNYGRERFDQLYVTGNISPGSSNYAQVYKKDLSVLEQEWRVWLDK